MRFATCDEIARGALTVPTWDEIASVSRPWWKVVINTMLRLVQPWPRKWVIYSRISTTRPPQVLGYGYGRVLHEDSP